MKRVLAWALFLGALAVVGNLASHIHNPWASENFKPQVKAISP